MHFKRLVLNIGINSWNLFSIFFAFVRTLICSVSISDKIFGRTVLESPALKTLFGDVILLRRGRSGRTAAAVL